MPLLRASPLYPCLRPSLSLLPSLHPPDTLRAGGGRAHCPREPLLCTHSCADRNRETALYDPAQPGYNTYVRVTRRINMDRAEEERLQKARMSAREASLALEAIDQKEKNEILELRSMGIRAAMKLNNQNNRIVIKDNSPDRSDRPSI